jgi:hypothetical protein
VLAGAGTQIDDMIGGEDRVPVVLDDDHRVATALQLAQRADELLVVAVVQADARLVEDVEHPDQLRADLGGEPDALRFAARQAVGGARQGQISEPDVEQELQSGAHFLEDQAADDLLIAAQLEQREERQRFVDRQIADAADVTPTDAHPQALRPQPLAVALRTILERHERLDPLADVLALGLTVAAHQARHEPLVAGLELALPMRALVAHLDPFLGAVEQQIALALRQLAERLLEVDAELARDAGEQRRRPVALQRPGALHRALAHRFRCIRHQQLDADLAPLAEAVALLAGAVRAVEREHPRRQLFERGAAVRTRIELAEQHVRAARYIDERQTAADAHRGLERVGEPPLSLRIDDQAVDDGFDRMLLVAFELDLRIDRHDLAVDAHAHETLLRQPFDQLAMLALAAAHDRRQHQNAGTGRQPLHLLDHLADGLLADLLAALVTVRGADARPQQPQVVVDLGDRADGRTRVVRRRPLFDGDRRRKTLDAVDVRLLHLAEELPRICRQRLDVAPLAFRVQRVEGQRRLAGTRQAGDDDERVARQHHVDVFQVVLARALDDDRPLLGVRRHGRRRRRPQRGAPAGTGFLDAQALAFREGFGRKTRRPRWDGLQ